MSELRPFATFLLWAGLVGGLPGCFADGGLAVPETPEPVPAWSHPAGQYPCVVVVDRAGQVTSNCEVSRPAPACPEGSAYDAGTGRCTGHRVGLLTPSSSPQGAGLSSLTTAMTEDGRLEVFAVGSDGALWHTWQSTPHGGPWHGWASLGGSVTSITAGRNGDGRLEVFGIGTDGALWHVWQTRAGTGGWGNWDSLGGGGGGGLQQIAAVTNGVAQLAVFALGADGTGSYLAQVHPSGGWGAWTPLGTRALELLPMRNESGRLEVFAVGAGSAVFHSWGQNPDFGLIDSTLQWTDRPWSPWTSLGGRAQAITAAVNDDGRLEVFAAGADGGVSHLWQKARSAGPWSGWSPMGGSAVQLSAAKNGDGRLEVFALGGDGTVTHAWQKAPSSAPWSGWSSLGGSVREIAAAANSDGRLEVFGIGTDGAVWHAWQRASDRSRWTGWQSLGQP